MKKLLALLMIVVCAFTAVSCGKTNSGSGGGNTDDETHTLNIIVSSSEIAERSDDNYVKSKIEEKFYQDKGVKIDLQVQVYSESDFNTVMSNKMAGSSWDAAVGYIGQAGIDEIVISQNVCMEIGDLIENYESLNKLVEKELTATTTVDGSVYGVPSLELSNQYGVLVRKDYMEQVGYTTEQGFNDDLGEITAKPNGKKKTLVNINDFTDMMRRMKAQIPTIKAPLSGYPWDIESTLAVGPFSSSSYMFKTVESVDDKGNATSVVPGQISEDYLKTMRLEYLWSKEGLWEEECYTGLKDKKQQAFVTGTTAIYVVDPEITRLISVARKTKANNPNATFTVLEPLYGVDESGNTTATRGYMGKQSANSCLVINKKSTQSEVMLEYLDWLASDVANYNLATYGVENEHWIDAGEGKYSYPENKKDRYETTPPYSGKYGLLKWQTYSFKLYDQYTEEEYGWINTVRTAPLFRNACENMLILGEDENMALNHQTAENDFFQDCLVKVWNGVVDPDTVFTAQSQKYRTTASEYLTWLTQQYNRFISRRK